MRFERKIFITYALLIVILVASLGFGFRAYIIHDNTVKTFQSLRTMAEKNSQQLDEIIRPMKFITDFLLSDMAVLGGLSTMATVSDDTRQGAIYREEARSSIRKALLTYGIQENFYRVSYFNDKKDFITSKFLLRPPSAAAIDMQKIPWLSDAIAQKGRPVLSGVYDDNWDLSAPRQVFSLGRAMPGIGYMEVQQDSAILDSIFLLSSNDLIRAVVFTAFDEILYANVDQELEPYYLKLARERKDSPDPNTVQIIHNPMTGQDEIIAGSLSTSSGMMIFLIQDTSTIIESLSLVTAGIIIVALLIVLVSLLYIYAVAKRLARPIRTLTHQIEHTALENIEQNITLENTNDEIEALSASFAQLLARLNASVIKEKKMSLLHVQSQLDSLQAQINPHFLYNVLNVISFRGMTSGDDEICDMCDSLASMLRYTTNTKTHDSTILLETEHLRNYVFLLSTRYKHKLVCTIRIDQTIEQQLIPKLMLQPIVENAIEHGYTNSSGVMEISVNGTLEQGWWLIRIRDNGQGFSQQRLDEITAQMKHMERKITEQSSTIEMEIGGMGLINTYARLVLLFGSDCVFSCRNHEQGGAEMTIGARYLPGPPRPGTTIPALKGIQGPSILEAPDA